MRISSDHLTGSGDRPGCRWHRKSVLLLAAVVSALALTTPVCARQVDEEFRFDIPTQPLASALKAYGGVTRLELFYESTVTAGRRSGSLHGAFTAEAALRRLLAGTGLSVASFEPGTVTILSEPSHQAKASDLAAVKNKAAVFAPYFSLIQNELRSAFCRSPATQVDASELIVRLWIDTSGAVARVELIGSTGSEDRDRVYAAA
ncbi:STN domain-containing protein, partial [Microbacteriaceae bacterium K1510]|nr:STN domain-containing protein [Microbacteriaceae bacterium K1510]